jgi:hypothetical protein
MSDRPLSERIVLKHAPACPSFETDGDKCTCGAEQERQKIAVLELELEEWKQRAVEFNEAYLSESRKLTAYLFSDANDVGFWKRLFRRR